MAKNDFFLDPDESQTLGDIDYMRKSKKVRRTFPKTLKNPNGFAIEKSVSSDEERDFSNMNQSVQNQSFSNGSYSYQPQTTFNSTPTPAPAPAPTAESTPTVESAPTPAPAPAPKQDNSMDMFRNMAKNIRKGR